MAKILTAERVSRDISDNYVFQRSQLAYHEAARRISGDVLEIGTGTGYGIEIVAPHASSFLTLDKIEPAGERPPFPHVEMRQAVVPPLDLPSGSFDYVISFQVIEHIKHDMELVREVHRVLRPGGKFILTTPNIRMSLTRNPWHVREYNPDQLRNLLGSAFASVEALGVFGNERIMEYYEKNRQGVRRITRFDVLDLQHRLPRWMLQLPYDLLNRLKASLTTQKRFLADAAHQLKTPLAGLRMQADLAQREGTSTEELKRSLQHIGRSSIRATHTVNQLLALARAEGGATVLAHQPCDLTDLVIDVVRDSVPRALEKGIDLGYDGVEPDSPLAQVDGNPTLLKELVRNLVDNAINYTPSSRERPGVITARVLADRFSQVVLLQVEDSGPGVPESERELIFQPFYRALGTDADGSGLGLPIVMEIARQHSAEVLIEDARPGHQPPGALFSVRFPARGAD